MLTPITKCLAVAVFILCLPQSSSAVFDPRYNCQTLHDETGVLVDGTTVDLPSGTNVRLTFSHVGYGYMPVYIELPDQIGIEAHDGFAHGEVEDLPNDKVLRHGELFLWVHSPTGSADGVVEIELDCGPPQ
ncbi:MULTISPECIES: hypothetical protein [unclassified Roseovarius]|uniref:hypothetical protein n=1 Tax=unclassified Roseovarius TaxID=2614913 RepID=UPI00273D8A02|nr:MULTISPECIES: hypothetical protein [unclassified Roseovarius]